MVGRDRGGTYIITFNMECRHASTEVLRQRAMNKVQNVGMYERHLPTSEGRCWCFTPYFRYSSKAGVYRASKTQDACTHHSLRNKRDKSSTSRVYVSGQTLTEKERNSLASLKMNKPSDDRTSARENRVYDLLESQESRPALPACRDGT